MLVLEVFLDLLGRCVGIILGELDGQVGEKIDLGTAEHDDLFGVQARQLVGPVVRLLLLACLLRLDALAEHRPTDRGEHVDYLVLREVALLEATSDHITEHATGSDRGAAGQLSQRPLASRLPPVPLEALGRDSNAVMTAERQTLGPPDVVAVQQSRGIAGQRVKLKKACVHGSELPTDEAIAWPRRRSSPAPFDGW